jgi:hypothetical protein
MSSPVHNSFQPMSTAFVSDSIKHVQYPHQRHLKMPPQRRYYVRLFASESLLSLDFIRRDCNRISLDLGCV